MGLDFFRKKKKKVWGGGNHSRLKRLKRYKNPVALPIPSLDPGLKKKVINNFAGQLENSNYGLHI